MHAPIAIAVGTRFNESSYLHVNIWQSSTEGEGAAKGSRRRIRTSIAERLAIK